MFSNRFKWDLESNRLAQLIADKRAQGARILDLTESNPTRAGFVFPVEEILSALNNKAAMFYEPQPKGLPVAREAVAGYYAERGLAVSAEHIHLTASTSEALRMIEQGAVKLDGEKVENKSTQIKRGETVIVQVGKRKCAKAIVQ